MESICLIPTGPGTRKNLFSSQLLEYLDFCLKLSTETYAYALSWRIYQTRKIIKKIEANSYASWILGKIEREKPTARSSKKFAYARTDRKNGLRHPSAAGNKNFLHMWWYRSCVRGGGVILGKFGNKLLTKNSQKIFLNGLTLRKFGAYRPWSRRSQIEKRPLRFRGLTCEDEREK